MGLCSSKAQQPQEVHDTLAKIGDHAAAKAGDGSVGAQPAAGSSPLPEQRPASTESGQQPAAAAGDGGGVSHSPTPASASHPASPTQHVSASSPPVGQQASAGGSACTSPNSAGAPAVTTVDDSLANGSSAVAVAVQQQQQQLQQDMQPGTQQQNEQEQQPTRQWDRAASVQAPSALASTGSARQPSQSGRSVKFADPVPPSEDGSNQRLSGSEGDGAPGSSRKQVASKRGMPRRSVSSSSLRPSAPANEVSEAVLAKQAEILRSNKTGKLRMRRGGLDSSFAALQDALTQDGQPMEHVATRAAGLKHIGFGPFKRENQDEFFIQVGDFGGVAGGNLFCVFDGHGTHGKDAALYSRQLLPRLLDVELRKYFMRVCQDSEAALRGAVEVLITEVFGDTERNLAKSGVNLASSGTTASVAFQRGNRLWVAAAGDSRAILCTRNTREQWRALPLTIDHRPRRTSERERIEAAGARVAPKRLPSGRSVGEPRLWLQDAGGPGLLLSRSLGDLTAATVGCTSDPEVTFTTLRPHTDQVLVMATDGVWDVLTNEQVCDIVVESPDPHIACRRVLDAALYEWEERMSADNITVLVVEFEWNEESVAPTMEHATATAFRSDDPAVLQATAQQPAAFGATPFQ